MNVELSPDDIKLISSALEAYEKEVSTNSLVTEMMLAVFIGKKQDPEFDAERARRSREVERETSARKSRTLLLRARLSEVSQRSSEFAR